MAARPRASVAILIVGRPPCCHKDTTFYAFLCGVFRLPAMQDGPATRSRDMTTVLVTCVCHSSVGGGALGLPVRCCTTVIAQAVSVVWSTSYEVRGHGATSGR